MYKVSPPLYVEGRKEIRSLLIKKREATAPYGTPTNHIISLIKVFVNQLNKTIDKPSRVVYNVYRDTDDGCFPLCD
jgi:hypothetical protein